MTVIAQHRERGGHGQEPDGNRRHGRRDHGADAGGMVAAEERRDAHGEHDQDRQQQAALQRAVVDGIGQHAGAGDQGRQSPPSKIDLASGRGSASRSARAGR